MIAAATEWFGLGKQRRSAAAGDDGTALVADERGATVIEFAFVLPILLLLLTGIIQFGSLFFLQNRMVDVARETARRLAVGELTTGAAAQSFALPRLVNWGVAYSITTTFPNPLDPDDRDVTVEITVPLAEAALVDYLGIFRDGDLEAVAVMRLE